MKRKKKSKFYIFIILLSISFSFSQTTTTDSIDIKTNNYIEKLRIGKIISCSDIFFIEMYSKKNLNNLKEIGIYQVALTGTESERYILLYELGSYSLIQISNLTNCIKEVSNFLKKYNVSDEIGVMYFKRIIEIYEFKKGYIPRSRSSLKSFPPEESD